MPITEVNADCRYHMGINKQKQIVFCKHPPKEKDLSQYVGKWLLCTEDFRGPTGKIFTKGNPYKVTSCLGNMLEGVFALLQ